MKKIFIFILALVACMSVQALTVKVGDLWYDLDYPNDGEASVTWGNSADDINNTQRYKGAITIPESFMYESKTYTVTRIRGHAIGDYATSYGAFTNCTDLTAISIPNSVTEGIGDKTFMNCSSLTAISIPNAAYISWGTFSGCSSLEVISIGSGVKEVNSGVNWGPEDLSVAKELAQNGLPALREIQVDPANPYLCSVDGVLYTKDMDSLLSYPAAKEGTTYTVPASVTTIVEGAFMNSKNLQTVTIQEGVKNIEGVAFLKAANLKNITLPASLTRINYFCFTRCSSLESVSIPNGTEVYIPYLFSGCTSLQSVQLPTSTNKLYDVISNTYKYNTIGMQMFAGCSSLETITIPDVVETIGDDAFTNCTSLASVTLPASLQADGIGNDAFYGCSNLQSFSIDNSNISYATTDGVLYTNDKDSLLVYPIGKASDLFTPESTVTTIAAQAFKGAKKLKAIAFPDGVTTIGDEAFKSCSELTSVTLPKKLTTLGEDAFASCSKLAEVTMPDGLITIGPSAFDSDAALKEIVIPSSVTTIGARAFALCTGLEKVTCYATIPPTIANSNCFVSVPASTPFYVPDLAYDTYNDDTQWKTLNLQRFAPLRYDYKSGFVATLLPPAGTLAYSGEIALPEVVSFGGFDYTVTGIAANAFRNANNLQSVSIPKTVTSIGEAAFYGATGLAEISVDAANTAFCSVDDVLMNKAQTTILAYAPGKADSEFTTPATVTTIALGAFAGCENLQDLTLTADVANIGQGAFADCTALKSITCEAATPPTCTVIGKGTASEETPFDGITKTIPVFVPASSLADYQGADGWSYFSNIQGPFDPTGKVAYQLVDLSTESVTEGQYLIVFDDNKAHAAVSGKDLIASSDELTIIGGVAYVPEATACAVTIAPLGVDSFSILLANGTNYLDLQAKNSVTTSTTASGFAITDSGEGDKTVQIAKYLASESNTYVLKHNGDYFRMYNGTVYTLPKLYRKVSTPTAVENTVAEDKAIKRLVNGQLLIEKNGKVFNAQGIEVK